MSIITKKMNKMILGIAFVFVFVVGSAYSLKSLIFKQEQKKAPKSDSVSNSENSAVLAQEEVCDEESDEYMFVGCNGFF